MSIKKSYADILKELSKDKKPEILNDKVLIIDGLNTFLRSYAVSPSSTDDGLHIGGISGFLYSIGYAIKRFSPTRCVVVFDGVGGSKRRKKIFSEYKANRNPKKNKYNRNYDFQDNVNDKKMKELQLQRLIEYLESLPLTLICIDNIEADDVIAYITSLNKNSNYTIMSADKDFLQLISDNVKVWSPTKKEVYTSEKVINEFHIHPRNFALFKAINGDQSDNIPGIRGFGPSSIQKYFEFLQEDNLYKIDDIINAAKKYEESKTCKNLIEGKNILDRNYKLMQLETSIIAGQTKLNILSMLEGEISILNKYQIHIMSLKDKLFTVIKNINTWILLFNKLNSFAIKHNKTLKNK
jgi:5'-3' exonuclease